jgi:predicted flap endonuclease-1-like 5' DNA nuclease
MPEVTTINVALVVLTTLVGGAVAWILRGKRASQEKAAINAGWQEQMAAQRTEHQRLVDQNKSLMDQNSQYQASHRDANNRAKELAEAVQTAYARRDALQREITEVRSSLETVLSQRDKLRTDMAGFSEESGSREAKDEKIFQLSRELESWHQRLPPLLERYRVRNEEALKLEADLTAANHRIEELQGQLGEDQTRIEPVRDPEALTNGLEASNDDVDGGADQTLQSVQRTDTAAAHSLRDDLKLIKGVGPAIERTLNDMGIFRFQQIADMTEYDIDRVAERLRGFHSRIYRENWIGQARELTDRDRRA